MRSSICVSLNKTVITTSGQEAKSICALGILKINRRKGVSLGRIQQLISHV